MDATVAAPSQSLGSLIDEYFDLREKKREIEKEVKEVSAQMDDLEARIINQLDADEVTLSRGRRASASISEEEVPDVEDWDAVHEYIMSNDALYLLNRKLTTAAWRELKDSGTLIPGTRPFTRRKLSVRKV